MDKIAKTLVYISIFFSSIISISCNSIEHVFLINKSSEPISINVILDTHEGEQIMNTQLQPNESDGWEFEAHDEDNLIVDKKLQRIVITSRYCKKVLLRSDILKIASKSGSWNIIIDNNIIKCS